MPIDRNIHKKNGFIIVLMAVMGMFTSCTDDTGIEAPRPSDVICFSASLGNDSPTVFTRSTAGHLSIVEEEWRLEGQPADTARTRATLTTSLEGEAGVIAYNNEGSVIGELNNKSFSFSSDELTSTDKPVYWKEIASGLTSMDVYAYAPYSLSGTITGKSFTYTIPGAATDQRDIIVAKSTVANSGFRKTIPLTFTHALTAVRFNLGSDITASNVNSITLSGVHNSGSYTIGEGWSGQSHSEDVSYTVTAGELLMLMPQTLPDEAKVTLTFKDNTTPAISASLKGQKWEEGKLVTYTLHESTQPEYIYLDLAAGNVTINATTYSGARYEKTGEESLVLVTKTNESYKASEDVVFYVYQSTETTRKAGKGIIQDGKFISPGYDQVKHGTQFWRDYITNNTDVDAVIENWVTDAKTAGREGTKYRIQVNAAANTSYKLIIDDVYSTYQTQSQGRKDGGIAFSPIGDACKNCTLTVVTVGDNRLGNIHYCTGNTDYGSRIIFEGEGSLTVADVDGNKKVSDIGNGYYSNHYCSAIGGNDDGSDNERCRGIVINSGILFAGSTAAENCSAIGGGGNGIGEVTINGGVVTAVAATTGTAIGGGIGYSSKGGKGIVTINGGNVYAYNLDNKRGIPSSAIGGAGSSSSDGTEGTVNINGGYVYAYSALGTAIGGGSSRTLKGGDAEVNITGGTVIAKSGKGAGIGGGSACTGGNASAEYDGGTATITISGDPIIRTGSVGGGSTGAGKGKIGSANITIEGGDIQAQFILAAGAKAYPEFTMTGGTIRNSSTADTEYLHVKEQGGAVWLEDGKCKISGGTIENCTATEGGAVYIAGTNNPTFTMIGGTISNCTSKAGNGGAVYLEGGTVTLGGGTIRDNLAQGGNGGGFYIKEGSFKMDGIDALITNNSAILRGGKGGDGGGLYVTSEEKDVTVDILSGTITQNSSDHWGGGVCVDMSGTEQAAKVTVGTSGETGPAISENHTLLSGGGLYVSGKKANIIINGGNIDGNSTSAYVPNVNVANEGGMVTLNGGNVSHKVVTFYANDGTDTSETQKIVTATNSLLVAPEFERTGYRLAGWNTRADGRGASYTDGQTMNITADLTLYAQWELQ